ncbi:MAG: chromosomal replication initiator protein DnaA [Gemmatimonadaceae bacterium]|nr:chromosomal replication initiator protein DnaA [Gemmatimonadaceae bacterium]NUO93919.1 chromosomal replication initiator protein DnaA [Gemmatimonadaceae bacterium]NUP57341.1 chromosomal replication initiator protein DnaA [Gemmatimonadaceae bacterium]NUP71315.1 chromosomal replication initiator protein DnaA [Gemmatimonadaceae bacterium]NUR34324.1 chromosomal replication initiator protein DnaA [Gemmatimonadaceae bacterium]
MTLSATEVWTRLLDRARLELPEQTFRTWLEPTEPLALEGSTIVVGSPDQFAADWNESKHAELLTSLAPVALGHPLSVVFRVHEERRTRNQMDLFVAPPAASATATEQRQKGGGINALLSERYTFEHFVIGKSNELAAAAAAAVAQAPGKVYNPLFLYGDTGLGKTHLMQAVAHDVLRRHPDTRITFIGTEQFTNEMIASIQTRTTQEFRRRYRETDMLLVDDVQFLKGKEATQEEFFHTFNALYEAGRQIILTSDRPPSEIPGLEARLVSRFQWGMVADIELPDLEHRIAILRNKALIDHLEMTIPEDVIRFIAEHVRSSVRELEGSIIKLLAYASLKHREITVDVAREALRDKLRPGEAAGAAAPGLNAEAIQHAVAKEWGVTPEGLRSKTRTKALTTPRQVAMYLMRELLGLQLVEIGATFGGRDHSTVIHSLDRVSGSLKEEPSFAQRVGKLRSLLEALAG